MAVPYVPGERVVQLEVIGTFDGVPVENVLYFQKATSVTPGDLVSISEALTDYWVANMVPFYPSTISITQVYATDLTTSTSPTYTQTNNLPENGGAAFEPMTRQDTLAISFRTAGRGRASRGRNYWLGLATDQVLNSNVTTLVATAIFDAYDGLKGNGTLLAGWIWGVFSRKFEGEWRTTGLFQPITSVVIVTTRVASQNGRLK